MFAKCHKFGYIFSINKNRLSPNEGGVIMKNTQNEKMNNAYGGCNFLVSIHYSENYSFQGVIEWLDTGKKLHFRSELELMSLILEATQSKQVGLNTLRTWTDVQNLKSV